MLAAFARLRDPAVGDWIEQEVRFPNSMVDRITPATTDEDRAAVAGLLGVDDAWPVVCEPFTQWVLEDDFGAGRPPLERAGVHLVDDVRPYELMKLRLLNAGHQALCYLGRLNGYRYVHEVAADPCSPRSCGRTWIARRPPPWGRCRAWTSTTTRRPCSAGSPTPRVRDTLERVGADTSDRIPKFLLPVVRDRLAGGGTVALAALVVASWARYAEGVDEGGNPLEVVDPLREQLTAAAARQGAEPTAFLEVREIFGDLADDARFTAAYTAALTSLRLRGARATARDAVGD
jgi:mannitol 2-dehydrogenase